MKTWWRKFRTRFMGDELFFRRTVRAAVVSGGAGFAFLADQFASIGCSPGTVKAIRIGGFVLVFLGMLVKNGERNPRHAPKDAQP